MRSFCKHERHKVIDWIKDPKWMTNEVLINTTALSPTIEHYIVRFTNDKVIHQFSDVSAQEKFGWFYLSGSIIRRSHKQRNGHGSVYVVKLAQREEFTPLKVCDHVD